MGGIRYSALTPELLAMTEELERLGGGDTRVGKAAICCCVASTATFGHGQSILKATSGGITVTDPRSAASTSCPKSKSFSVPCCLQSEASGSMVCNSLGQTAVDWTTDGFNATILAVGQSGTGKTTTFFGNQTDTHESLLPGMLHSLFSTGNPASHRIGLSCWELVKNHLVDLLADGSLHNSGNQACCNTIFPGPQGLSILAATEACQCVQACSTTEALSLLHLAQSNSSNWTSDQHGRLLPLPNRAHLFIRIVVHNIAQQQMSMLHVIDLAGSQSLADSHADEHKHQDKLAINQQLLSLSKVVSKLSRLSAAKGGASGHVTSARDSPLMQLVGPLIAGNARLFMLASVSPHPDSYLDTINTLRIAARAQTIQTACMRTSSLEPDQIRMLSAGQVLAQAQARRLSSAATVQSIRAVGELWSSHNHASKHGNADQAVRKSTHTGHMFKGLDYALDSVGQPDTCRRSRSDLSQLAIRSAEVEAPAPSVSARDRQAGGQAARVSNFALASSVSDCVPTWHPQQGRSETGLPFDAEPSWCEAQQASSYHPVQPAVGQADGMHMSDMKELTWESVLQAASGNGQASAGPGDLSPEPSFAFHRTSRPASATQISTSGSDQAAAQSSPTPVVSSIVYDGRGQDGAPVVQQPCRASFRRHDVFPGQSESGRGSDQRVLLGHNAAGHLQSHAAVEGQLECRADGAAGSIDLPVCSAYTPQELADHLGELKREFREICSNVLNDNSREQHQPGPAAAQVLPAHSMSNAVPRQVPITNKHCSRVLSASQDSCQQAASASPVAAAEVHMHPASCIIPCQAAQWPELEMSPPLKQQHRQAPAEAHKCAETGGMERLGTAPVLGHTSCSPHVTAAAPQQDVQQQAASPGSQQSDPSHDAERETCQGWPLAQVASHVGLDRSDSADFDHGASHRSRALQDGLRPRSPEAVAHAHRCLSGAAERDSNSREQQEVADLRVNNEALLCMLERERQHSQQLAQRLQQAEADALERSLEQEVGLEEGRLAAVALRSKCRKLESESLFAEVFEKYEDEIRQLQVEVQQLKQSNVELNQQWAASEVMGPHPRSPLKQVPIPSQPSALMASAEGCALQSLPAQTKLTGLQQPIGLGPGKAVNWEQSQKGLVQGATCPEGGFGQSEVRLQTLRKQLKRSMAHCQALKVEVAELKRRDRTAELYKKKANDCVRRVSELQKEVLHCKQELHACRLAAQHTANHVAHVQDNNGFLEAEHVQALSANQDLQASVQTLREQVRLLRSQRQRAVVLAHLPQLRPEAQPQLRGAPSKCAALEVVRRLQLEPAQTPKVAALVERVAEEVHLLSGDRQALQQRESILMDLLTGHSPL